MRRAGAAVLAVAMLATTGVDLAACGDKFLRIGRSMRYGRYAAAYPASILIYSPRHSVPARVTDFAQVLKRAGHTPLVVTEPQMLAAALASGTFDIVLTGLAQSDDVIRRAQAASSKPDVMPVIFEGNQADVDAAAKISSCRIQLPGQHRNDALAEIDHKMELRGAGARRR